MPACERGRRCLRALARVGRHCSRLLHSPLGPFRYANQLILYVVWGSTYLGIAVAVESMPPFLMAGSRFAVAGLLMLGLAVVFGRGLGPIRLPTRRELRDSTIVGGLRISIGDEVIDGTISGRLEDARRQLAG